jgi:hypothetical protein
MSQEADSVLASVKSVLRDLGFLHLWETRFLLFTNPQEAIVESRASRIRGVVLRVQVFVGPGTQEAFLSQLRAHRQLAKTKTKPGPGAWAVLEDVLISPHVKLPILVFREAGCRYPLDQFGRTLSVGDARKWRIAHDLIALVDACCKQNLTVGPLTMQRCRSADDGATIVFDFFGCDSALAVRTDLGLCADSLVAQNLWTLGLLLFEVLMGVKLEEQLVRLLNGDARLEKVKQLYEDFLKRHKTQVFESFAMFCFPGLKNMCQDSAKQEQEQDGSNFEAINSLLCLCLQPQEVCQQLPQIVDAQKWEEAVFRAMRSIFQSKGVVAADNGDAGESQGWFKEVDSLFATSMRCRLCEESQNLVERLQVCGLQTRAAAVATMFALERSPEIETGILVSLLFAFWFSNKAQRESMGKVAAIDVSLDVTPALRNLRALQICLAVV